MFCYYFSSTRTWRNYLCDDSFILFCYLLVYSDCIDPLQLLIILILVACAGLNDLMETKGGKKKSSSSKSLFYEAPLGYSIEDVRPHGGIKKFRSAAYSNVSSILSFLAQQHVT